MDHDFYEPIWYYDEILQFPEPKRKLARWLGEAHNAGQAMSYFILPQSRIPIVRSSIQPITSEEKQTITEQDELNHLDEAIKIKCKSIKPDEISNFLLHQFNEDDYNTPQFEPVEEDIPEADNWDPESYDTYISAQVLLPVSGSD
jgi:hypothetical protein